MSKHHPSGLRLVHSLHRRLLSLQLQLRAGEQRALVLGPPSNVDVLLQIIAINNCTFCIINIHIFQIVILWMNQWDVVGNRRKVLGSSPSGARAFSVWS